MDILLKLKTSACSSLAALLLYSPFVFADNGDLKWTVKSDEGSSFGHITVTQDTIVVTDSKNITALTFDGAVKWQNSIDASWFPDAGENDWLSIRRSSVVSTTVGTIIVNSLWEDRDYISALDINGNHLWNQNIGSWVFGGSPSVNLTLGSDNTLYTQVSGDQFYTIFFNSFSFDEQSSTVTLENEDVISSSGYVVSSSSAEDGTLYMAYYRGAIDSKLNALNADYSVKWETEWNFNGFYRTPVIGADGTLYFQELPKEADDKFALVASSPDGIQKWRLKEPVDHIVLDRKGNIIGLDNRWNSNAILKSVSPEGVLNWSVELEESSYFTPTIAENGTLLLTSAGTLIALTENGEIKWQSTFDDVIRAIARILDDGTVLVRGDNAIYAIESDAGKLADTPWPMYSANNHNSFSHYGDLDKDGLLDSMDEDDDNDSYPDVEDAFPRDSAEHVDTDSDGIGNNTDEDDDNDGMPDNFEVDQGLDPLNASDAALDSDGDGFPNSFEYRQRTDMFDAEDYPGKVEKSGGTLCNLIALLCLAGLTRLRLRR